MLILEPPACRLVICVDAGQGDPGELVRALSSLDGAADCALFLYAPQGEDDAALQALRLAAAAFPGPNRVLPAASGPDRNAGWQSLIAEAPADWILFIGADTLPAGPGFVRQYIDAARAAPGPGAVLGGMSSAITRPDPTVTWVDPVATPERRAADPGLFVSGTNLLVHRDILTAIPFDSGFACIHFADIDWGLRVHAAYPIRHIDNPVVRGHSGTDQRRLDEAANSGPGLARLLHRHPGLADRLALIALARRVKGIPLLAPVARLIASSCVLPARLRARAGRLYVAAACSPYIEPG
jgi:hypothetical protein